MPIQFTCPHCQTQISVDDRFAGVTGPCRNCSNSITIPGNPVAATPPTSNQFSGEAQDGPRGKSSSKGLIFAILAGIGCMALPIVGIMVALLLPAVQSAREAARRAGCINNQREIVLAMQNYESANRSFPPAFSVDENGQPMHSWRVLILPYMEEGALYERFKLDEPWDSEHNLAVAKDMPVVYACPSTAAAETTTDTSYMVVTDPNSLFPPGPRGCQLRQIKDGTTKTVMVVETSKTGVLWTEPTDLNIDELDMAFGEHSNVTVVCYADGHTEVVPEVTEEMVIRNDGL